MFSLSIYLDVGPEPNVDKRHEVSFFVLFSRCKIDWNKGENVTVKTIKKKQKHKGKGTIRTVTKQIPNDSFFNFFNPPEGMCVLFIIRVMLM